MPSHFLTAIRRGKTLYRFLMEERLRARLPDLQGKVLDLASGSGSYASLFSARADVLRTDHEVRDGIALAVDCNRPLPFPDASFDAVLLLNALYILEDRLAFFREVWRVLKPGGTFLLMSPFIANEMPEPHDYVRLTREGLERELRALPWQACRIERVGERFSAAANLLHPAWRWAWLKILVYRAALWLDTKIPLGARTNHPAPLGYFLDFVK